MKETMRTLLIAAGGTGGHIMPGLAVARAAMNDGWQVTWMGHPDHLEGRLVPAAGLPLLPLIFPALRGKGASSYLALPWRLMRSVSTAVQHLRRLCPQVVLGLGGYPSVPGGLAARLLGIPLLIHEQNGKAGLANRLLCRFANRVLSGFPGALPQATVVGNPVRSDIAALPRPQQRFSGRSGALHLLVLGGSQGARALNQTVPQALALLPAASRPQVIHQTGEKHFVDTGEAYRRAGVQAEIRPFISNMAQVLGDCDLAICRAGAMTVSELAAAGAASVLIPFPYASDDHQTVNAKFLSAQGAAVLMPESQLTAQSLAQQLTELSRAQCLVMAEKARSLIQTDAALTIVRCCEELLENAGAA